MAEEEMPPPSRRPQLSTNDDFRKLLETPRADRFAEEKRTPRHRKQQPDAAKPKTKRPPRPKLEPEEKVDEGPGYRDRADERRKGVNPDYERMTNDLANLTGSSLNADLNQISVEDSKYLGGDVDHTHLVKGLDYALLQKVRGEMSKDEAGEAEVATAHKQFRETEVVKFKSAAGRGVFGAVFSRPKGRTNDLFLPGRTAFVFDLEGGVTSDVPMTLRRSKADCPTVVETIRGGMDPSVLERMVKIMSYMRGTSGKPGKMKKKDKLRMLQMMEGIAANGAVKTKAEDVERRTGPADAEADIFGDAGRDYVPELPKSRTGNGANRPADDMEMDDSMPPPPPPPPPEATVGPARPGGASSAAAAYAAYGSGEDVDPPPPPPPLPATQDVEDLELDRLAGLAPPPPEPRAPDARVSAAPDIIRKDTEDAYEELYPAYGGFSAAAADSDEEDLTHMDSKEGKSRFDFNTEEQWEKYKGSKEMMPKAAFQFGIKMSDGRKGHRQLGKAVEQKEQKQLRQIQSMLKKNHGEQYSHAFTESRLEKESGPAVPKRRRI